MQDLTPFFFLCILLVRSLRVDTRSDPRVSYMPLQAKETKIMNLNRTACYVTLLASTLVTNAHATEASGYQAALNGAALCAYLQATVGGLCPDITEEHPAHLNIKRAHKQEWLRFTSTHWNEGLGPLQIRGGGVTQTRPCVVEEAGTIIDSICTYATQEILDGNRNVVYTQPAGVAVFHPEHNHWHQDNVADFVLRSGSLDGPVVSQATKVTYCLIDYDAGGNGLTSAKYYFECGADLQGISVGIRRRVPPCHARAGGRHHHRAGRDLLPDPRGRSDQQVARARRQQQLLVGEVRDLSQQRFGERQHHGP